MLLGSPMGHNRTSISSKLVLVSDPRTDDFRHLGLGDAPFYLFTP